MSVPGSFSIDTVVAATSERLYTPLEAAIDTLRKRQKLAQPTPNPLDVRLRSTLTAVLWRHLATPNYELGRFVSICAGCGLMPVVLTFHRDKFLNRNPAKCALARLRFSDSATDSHLATIAIADWVNADGQQISSVQTLSGGSLVTFHRDLLSISRFSTVTTGDISDWLHAHGATAKCYYHHFFDLFIRSAILFDSFLHSSGEESFTSEVVMPAFEGASSRNGLRPLVCRLDPENWEGHPHWLRYPKELQSKALMLLQRENGSVEAANRA
jgi:hypothetical protein